MTTLLFIAISPIDVFILTSALFIIFYCVFYLFKDRQEEKRQEEKRVKQRAVEIAMYSRAYRGIYFNSKIKSTSVFLQLLVKEMSDDDLFILINTNILFDEEKKELKIYLAGRTTDIVN